MYGKQVALPRLQAYYGDDIASYAYSGLVMQPLPWIDVLVHLKDKISAFVDQDFNAVLANLYRNQNDTVGWHSDDEKELGINPVIASLSFGQERNFTMKHKLSGEKLTIPVTCGSLLIMSGETQQYWLHSVPRTKAKKLERINLTYRKIYSV